MNTKQCHGEDHHYNPITLDGECVECGGTEPGEASTNEVSHTLTPWELDTLERHGVGGEQEFAICSKSPYGGIIAKTSAWWVDTFSAKANAAFIIRAVNSHEELLEAAKNARNVLAGLVTGDLKEVRADSPALQSLRSAIAKAEGSPSSHGEK